MDIDPNLYVGVEKLPNETLENIFNNLDPSSLNVVGQVCEKWRDVVQLIHDQAWKSLTKAVMLKKDTIGPKYEGRGWIEGVHSINQCKCIDIARDLVIYTDMKKLNSDLELLESLVEIDDPEQLKNEMERLKLTNCEFVDMICETLPEIQAASRLAAAGLLNSIGRLTIVGIDLTSIRHLRHLIGSVKNDLFLFNVTHSDWTTIFKFIKCEQFKFNSRALNDAELESLTEVLKVGVEGFFSYENDSPLPLIENYDGKGKCKNIILLAISHFGFDIEEKIWNWTTSRGWDLFWSPSYARMFSP